MRKKRNRCIRFNTYASMEEFRIQASSKSNWDLALRYREWLLAQQYSHSTRQFYDRVVRKYLVLLGRKVVGKTTHFDVRRFVALMARSRLTNEDSRRHLYALRSFYDFLLLGGVIDAAVPRFVIPRSRYRERIPRVLSETEMRRLIRSAATLRDRTIIEVMYATGCRLGELTKIKLEDINLQRRSILLHGKRGPRVTFFGNHAAKCLREYMKIRGSQPGNVFLGHCKHQLGSVALDSQDHWIGYWSDYSEDKRKHRSMYLGTKKTLSRASAVAKFRRIFPKNHVQCPSRPTALGAAGVQRIFQVASVRAGLSKVTPHTIRHTCATHMLIRGANIREIQEMLGHASILSTQVYTSIHRERVAASFKKFHPRS